MFIQNWVDIPTLRNTARGGIKMAIRIKRASVPVRWENLVTIDDQSLLKLSKFILMLILLITPFYILSLLEQVHLDKVSYSRSNRVGHNVPSLTDDMWLTGSEFFHH